MEFTQPENVIVISTGFKCLDVKQLTIMVIIVNLDWYLQRKIAKNINSKCTQIYIIMIHFQTTNW